MGRVNICYQNEDGSPAWREATDEEMLEFERQELEMRELEKQAEAPVDEPAKI